MKIHAYMCTRGLPYEVGEIAPPFSGNLAPIRGWIIGGVGLGEGDTIRDDLLTYSPQLVLRGQTEQGTVEETILLSIFIILTLSLSVRGRCVQRKINC